jgi:replication factor A1
VHGRVELKYDLRLVAVLDDGTGAVTVFFGNELSEKFLAKSLNEIIKMISEDSDADPVNDNMLADLILREIRVKGNLFHEEYGISILATALEIVDYKEESIRDEAQAILNELEI